MSHFETSRGVRWRRMRMLRAVSWPGPCHAVREVRSSRSAHPMITCAHRDRVRRVSPVSTGCAECSKLGERWVRLRMCLTCGHVGCCDSSRGRHATGHFEATGHPLMRSVEAGETRARGYEGRRGFGETEVAAGDPPAPETRQIEPV